jgi:transcription antitermination factor NusG
MTTRARPGPDDWCILRMSGPRTLTLTRSLADAGIEAWTPTATRLIRVPRSRAKRERDFPIMPTFVFVRARHLAELRRCLSLPSNPHPAFSIFRHGGGIPLIADGEIGSVRAIEEQGQHERQRARDREADAARRAKRHHVAVGSEVEIPEGGFAGLTGIVEESDGRFALVCFGGSLRVKVASFLLASDEV